MGTTVFETESDWFWRKPAPIDQGRQRFFGSRLF
jgi:hypothetical protein